MRIFLIELISIHSLTNHSQKKTGKFSLGKSQMLIGKTQNFTSPNTKGIDKLEKLNREIRHDRKNEKVAVIVENIQIIEI